MRYYPDIPARRASTLLRDLVVVGLLVFFAWVALKVHDAVDGLAVLGQGVNEAGTSVQDGFESAADAVDGTPLVGDDLADGLRAAGEESGGNVADLGQEGEDQVHQFADILGASTFLIPATIVLFMYLPARVAQVRRLTDAERVLVAGGATKRILAMRAAFALPYGQLLAYTRDPLGDLEAERYDALIEAVLEDAGLRSAGRKEDV